MFLIRCSHCGWSERTTGFSSDLSHLKEIKSGCEKCGKPRVFICPECKKRARMVRLPS